MSNFKSTVALTSGNAENLSRNDMLQWVNRLVHGKYVKIEELCSGVAYCQMMDMMFPNCINLKRVKMDAKLEHEYFHNMKLFQGAFIRLKLDKTVPIESLIKGSIKENLEFLQWFKKFFDSQIPGLRNIVPPAFKTIRPRAFPKPEEQAAPSKQPGAKQTEAKQPAEQSPSGDENEKALKELMEEKEAIKLKIDSVTAERNQYYQKLRLIEDMIHNTQEPQFCERVQSVIHQKMD
ncbi:hypothetical protein KR018_001484, partial [Drosophila ironensis]